MKHYFEILELQPGATPDEVKAAYRDLAKVWHPDRFRSDSPRLQSKAAEKLAEINEAYEKIRAYQARQRMRKQAGENDPAAPFNAHTGYRPYTPNPSAGSDAGSNYSGYARPMNERPQYRQPASGPARPQPGTFRNSHTHTAGNTHHHGSAHGRQTDLQQASSPMHTLKRQYAGGMQYGPYSRNYRYAYRQPRRSKNTMAFYLAMVALLAVTGSGVFFYVQKNNSHSIPTLADWASTLDAEPPTPSIDQPNRTSASQNSREPEATGLNGETGEPAYGEPNKPLMQGVPPVPRGYFTLGSSKEEVLMAQGEPQQVRLGLFRYGFSTVFFEDNEVIGWHQASDTPLKVMLRANKPASADYFTLGSTRDEVIAVQGTPDHYRDRGRELRYGESRVTFERGRVVNWHQDADTPLKARLLPAVISDAVYFTHNSTRDEVLSVQGTPDHFGQNTFHYGYSTVQFENDRVIGWNQTPSYPLKIELQPSQPTSSKYFTLGSTRDEVIAAQGTPDQYSERLFKYGYSTVSFENDRVVSWYQSPASPLNVRSDAAG